MSKRDLEELLRRLAYAAYRVARDCGCRNDLRFRMSDYRTSIGHAKLMRRERRWAAEVDRRIARLGAPSTGSVVAPGRLGSLPQ